ncbi:hypothetical protein HMPREF0981_02722, partial [Erysipelotrichaceae bacterium 6_1_45]
NEKISELSIRNKISWKQGMGGFTLSTLDTLNMNLNLTLTTGKIINDHKSCVVSI